MLGAVCLLALIALLVVTLSRIGAAQAAGRGDVMKNLRNALAAACAAANKTTVMFLTQITRTSRNAAKGLLEVLSFKSIWGVDRRTRVQSPFGDADSASTQFLSLAKRFRKRFVVPTLQAFVAVAAFCLFLGIQIRLGMEGIFVPGGGIIPSDTPPILFQ